MEDVLERQQFTPEGQELPAWLSYQAVTTTIDGVAVTTGTILKLPLTYYGPSIPLGPDWTYGGASLPTSTIEVPTLTDTTSLGPTNSLIPISFSASVLSSSISASSSVPLATETSSPTTSSQSSRVFSSSSEILGSNISTASSAIPFQPSLVSSSTPMPTLEPADPLPDSDLRTTYLVLLPSVLGPLFLALLILLICICIIRHRRRTPIYARTATSDRSIPIAPPPASRRVSLTPKLPFTPPRIKSTGEKAPLLTVLPIEPEEEDITDFAQPRSSILSRLSLGLGIAPSLRRISNGTAEKAYRTPSWALASLAALPRRISSGFRSAPSPIILEDDPVTPIDSSGNEGTSDPQSAGLPMGDDELFYRSPARTFSSRPISKSSRSSRSTRGTGPSNWQRNAQVVEEDGPPISIRPRTPPTPLTPENAAAEDLVWGSTRGGGTVSVGVPETPGTIASVGSYLGMELGERDRRSRWIDEGDRMEFPVPPQGRFEDDSGMSLSGSSDYRSAPTSLHQHTTPPPYNSALGQSTIRLIEPQTDTTQSDGLILSSRLTDDRRGSDTMRRSFVGEPLLGPPMELAEFGQIRSVSGGQINTLITVPHSSNNRSSHYASFHISDSSRSQDSQSSSGLSSDQAHRGLSEELAESGMTFGAVSDRALRGRRSHATLVSARSVRIGQSQTGLDEGGDLGNEGGPVVPRRNPARPLGLPRLISGVEVGEDTGVTGFKGDVGREKTKHSPRGKLGWLEGLQKKSKK